MSAPTLAAFLLPEGFARPAVAAVVREGSVLGEAGRYVLRTAGDRRARRSAPYTGRTRPRASDPVVLVPGFLAGDASLALMARTLRGQGFRTYRSHIRANVGCTLDAAAQLEERLESIVIRRGTRVQIVGHSLGGMLARGIAVRRPDLVAGIVTLGSPMLAPGAHHRALTASVDVLVRLSRAGLPGLMAEECVAGGCARQSFDESQQPMPRNVGFTAVYSKRDGIVDWRACAPAAAHAVEVTASHVGMALDPRVIDHVAASLRRHGLDSVVEVDRGVTA
ncbi:alpha/beta hydrolase [Nocardioides sp. cx-169]|uniref:esterase/lipase family protein n=1 Tax=Nocardioides sp. cx-169 TaxID=2899080 RepID=UPI001E4B1E75|nr:alpha/beta hydrolase [Nocardioides sp. cx-169]MCD4536107.1 alpha/beta hydrolase [Nocardioides sp. cx-169]